MPGESTSISISTGADSYLANLDDPVSDTSSRLCDCPEEQLGLNIMDVGLIACVSATLLMGYCARSTCDVAEPAGYDLVRHGHHRVTPQMRTMANLLRRGGLPERVLSPGHEPAACAVCIEEMVAEDKVRTLGCGHAYHATCVDPWLIAQQTCPLCCDNVLEGAYRASNV